MGGGNWTTESFTESIKSRGFRFSDEIKTSNVKQFYKANKIDPALDPFNVVRECRDSEEHPETLPIILALDVTGSMGTAAKSCAAELDNVMKELYKTVKDVEFCMVGIGDMIFDRSPVQVTQFESDIRILDQTSKIWFEGGGGPNMYESYTAAWYFGLYHTELDCWKRGKKGIIITLGDEMLNPYLSRAQVEAVFGNRGQVSNGEDLGTNELYELVTKKFDVFHIGINDPASSFKHHVHDIHETWKKLLGDHYLEGDSNALPQLISTIVGIHTANWDNSSDTVQITPEGIRW